MAKKERNTDDEAARTKVRDLLFDCFGEIHALDDIAQNFDRCPFTVHTMQYTVSAIAARLESRLARCEKVLAAEHPAVAQIEAARNILRSLREFSQSLYDGDDGYVIPLECVGIAMRSFAVQIGRSVERAEIAMGARFGSAGYLDNPFNDPDNPIPSRTIIDAGSEAEVANAA